MLFRATEGTVLTDLAKMAIPFCQAAECERAPRGAGRPPDYEDWAIAVLITVAIMRRHHSKSSQYRFLHQHRKFFMTVFGWKSWPTRSTYFARYRNAHRLFHWALIVQGRKAIEAGWADPTCVAVDKSLLFARGPRWNQKDRKKNVLPALRGIDRDSQWGYSTHHGWVQGYSYEVVVTASAGTTVWPCVASASTANLSERTSFGSKIELLPKTCRFVLADGGYNKNAFGERIEKEGASGRRFVCPPGRMFQKETPSGYRLTRREQASRQWRVKRADFYRSREGKKLYPLRGKTVEPFNEWFKRLFGLHDHVWHRGLKNNQTQLLAALFAYGLLLHYNHQKGKNNGQVQWILDSI